MRRPRFSLRHAMFIVPCGLVVVSLIPLAIALRLPRPRHVEHIQAADKVDLLPLARDTLADKEVVADIARMVANMADLDSTSPPVVVTSLDVTIAHPKRLARGDKGCFSVVTRAQLGPSDGMRYAIITIALKGCDGGSRSAPLYVISKGCNPADANFSGGRSTYGIDSRIPGTHRLVVIAAAYPVSADEASLKTQQPVLLVAKQAVVEVE